MRQTNIMQVCLASSRPAKPDPRPPDERYRSRR